MMVMMLATMTMQVILINDAGVCDDAAATGDDGGDDGDDGDAGCYD